MRFTRDQEGLQIFFNSKPPWTYVALVLKDILALTTALLIMQYSSLMLYLWMKVLRRKFARMPYKSSGNGTLRPSRTTFARFSARQSTSERVSIVSVCAQCEGDLRGTVVPLKLLRCSFLGSSAPAAICFHRLMMTKFG